MSNDLTARLRLAERERDELLEWQNELASRMPEEWDGDEAQEELIGRYFEHLQECEHERDEARRAAQEMSEKLDARINVGAERDEAVQLLEAVEPILRPHLLGGSSDFRSLNRWLRDRDAFLARHKEAQG